MNVLNANRYPEECQGRSSVKQALVNGLILRTKPFSSNVREYRSILVDRLRHFGYPAENWPIKISGKWYAREAQIVPRMAGFSESCPPLRQIRRFHLADLFPQVRKLALPDFQQLRPSFQPRVVQLLAVPCSGNKWTKLGPV
jgi:hypothetical protein